MSHEDTGEALRADAALMRKLGLQLAGLQEMGLADLRARHLELFGEDAKSKNLPFLRRKLAFRLQERVDGGLSPAARERLNTLAPRELPVKKPQTRKIPAPPPRPARDPRLPVVGTVLTRAFRGLTYEVEVLETGFRYRGRLYTSLSTIAKEITGTSWNGFAFFGLGKEKRHGEA